MHSKVSKGTILENVLGKEEHSGRVRGVGSDLNQTSYFKSYRGNKMLSEICSRQQEELMAERKRNVEQDQRIAKLEAIVFKREEQNLEVTKKGSCSVKIKTEETRDVEVDARLGDDDVDMFDTDVKILDKNEILQVSLDYTFFYFFKINWDWV